MKLRPLVMVSLLAAAFMSVPGGQAQVEEDGVRFWMHHSNADGCCAVWMNPMKDDPDHNLDAVSNLVLPHNDALPSTPVNLNHWHITYTNNQELPDPIMIRPAADIEFDLYVGAEQLGVLVGVPGAPAAGTGTFKAILRQAGTTIAEVESSITYVAEFIHLELAGTPQVEMIDPAAGAIEVHYEFRGTTYVISIGGGDSVGHSSIFIPTGSGKATPSVSVINITENITTPDAADIAVSFPNATSGSLVYNWAQNLTDVDGFLDGFATNGSATLTITDGSNAIVHEGPLSDLLPAPESGNATGNGTNDPAGNATANETQERSPLAMIRNATAGDWTIRIDIENFTGEIVLSLRAPAPEQEDADAPTKKAGSGTSDDEKDKRKDEETGFDPAQEQESPGLALPLLVAGLVGFALRRRR